MPNLERGEPKVRIRPMEHEDIDSVIAIDRKITGVRRAVTYTELITGDLGGVLALSLVAEVNGEVKGFILARRAFIGEPPTEVGLVQILGVDPDYQRRGIATKMVNALLDTCRTKKLGAVWILINVRDSQLAGLFEHLGFRRGELIDYTKTL
jgi:ribosomal protein S18 acetylase RimI-like enzyme